MVIYLAGLQGVPTALYQAAVIDGANGVGRFFHITLPRGRSRGLFGVIRTIGVIRVIWVIVRMKLAL